MNKMSLNVDTAHFLKFALQMYINFYINSLIKF